MTKYIVKKEHLNPKGELFSIGDEFHWTIASGFGNYHDAAINNGFIEEVKEDDRWRAVFNEAFWITDLGSIDGLYALKMVDNYKGGVASLSNKLYETGNYFKSEETATKVAEALKLFFERLHTPNGAENAQAVYDLDSFHEARKAVLADDKGSK